MKATNATKSAAPTKNNRKRDSEGETKEEEGSLAKKQKLAEPSCSLSKFVTAILADGDETTKFELTKRELVGLINHVTARCIAKLQCLAATEEEEEHINHDEPNDPIDEYDKPNEPNEPIGTNMNVDEPNEPNMDDNEPNEPNEANNQANNEANNQANNQPRQFYMNSTVHIANQELELPNSHAVISRSRLGRLLESDKLGRKLKAKIAKPKQYRSSHLGRRYYNSALYQAPRLSTYMAEQIFPMIIAGFLADAGITFEAEAIASSCPSAKTLIYFIVDGSVDTSSILWLEDQFRDAAAI